MDKVNEKVFELLKEIDDLCVKNNIRYYLSGNIALHIRNHKVLPSGAYYAKITMTKTNLFKFINLFENKKNENRQIDYWGNNENYANFTLRYVDINTLCYHVLNSSCYSCHGIFIEIDILRDIKEIRRVNLVTEKMIVEKNFYKQHWYRILGFKNLLIKCFAKINLFFNKKKFINGYFNKIISKNFDYRETKIYKKGNYTFNNSIITDKINYIKLYGYNFQTFSNLDYYFSKLFPNINIDTKEVKISRKNIILNDKLPYAIFIKQLDHNNWDNNILNKLNKYLMNYKHKRGYLRLVSKIREQNNIINEHFNK